MIDFSRSPLWVYGHSFTQDLDPGVDWEWMPKLAAQLGMPSWKTFGVGSSRMMDAYGDISRLAPTAPQTDSAWPWDDSRRGAVVLQCETNDAINPPDNGTSTLLADGKTIANFEQTLSACLMLLAAENRWDWNLPSASYGTWSGSSNPMFLTGGNAWTDYSTAWRELNVTVGSSGTIGVIGWDVSDTISVPNVGGYQISVDGAVVYTAAPRSAQWQNIWTRRSGGYLHNVGPKGYLVSGIAPGPHTVRVTSTGGGRVYLDQLVTLRAEPLPVLVTKDPPLAPSGNHWLYGDPVNLAHFAANRRNLHGAVNRASSRFANVRAVGLTDMAPELYMADGIHPNPDGMLWQAGKLADALRDFTAAYEPDTLYAAA